MPIARTRYLGVAQESATYGTLPGSPTWVYYDIASSSLDTPADDKLIWRGVANRAPTMVAPGAYSISGDIVIPVDGKLFGWFLKFLFGSVTSALAAGESAVYKHTYKPANILPSFTVRVGKDIFEHEFTGCVINEMRIEADKDFVMATIGLVGQKDKKNEICTMNVHKVSDTANTTAAATATNQATAETLANELKTDYNLHIASTTYHAAADATNAVTSPNASEEATLVTLVNELKADINAHRNQAGVHVTNDSNHLITAADATNLATALTLVKEIKADYNAHLIEVQITAPTFLYRFNRFNWLYGATAQPIERMTLTYRNKARSEDGIRLGSRFPAFVDIGERELTVEADLSFASTDHLERFWGGQTKTEPVSDSIATQAATISLQGLSLGVVPSYNHLNVNIPKLAITAAKQQISKRERIKQSITGVAIYKNSTEFDVTMEFTNDQVSYPDPA